MRGANPHPKTDFYVKRVDPTELKPCTFCGAQLEQGHNHYIAIDGTTVDYDYYSHPLNGCILEERLNEMGVLFENDIEKWNERVCL